jgi:hypothetical protein
MALADEAISTWHLAISQILSSTSWSRALRKCINRSAEKTIQTVISERRYIGLLCAQLFRGKTLPLMNTDHTD